MFLRHTDALQVSDYRELIIENVSFVSRLLQGKAMICKKAEQVMPR